MNFAEENIKGSPPQHSAISFFPVDKNVLTLRKRLRRFLSARSSFCIIPFSVYCMTLVSTGPTAAQLFGAAKRNSFRFPRSEHELERVVFFLFGGPRLRSAAATALLIIHVSCYTSSHYMDSADAGSGSTDHASRA